VTLAAVVVMLAARAVVGDPAASASVADAASDARPAQASTGDAVRPGEEGVFRLRSGGTIAGRVVSSGPDGEVVELRSGQRLRLAPGALVERLGTLPVLGDPRDPDPEDPARSHHLHVPSALALPVRGVEVRATAASLTEVDVGLTPWLTATAALSMPSMYLSPLPRPALVASVAAHAHVSGWLHGLAGVQAVSGRGATTALLFGAVTAGTPAAHVTLYAGPPIAEAGRLGRFDEVVLAAAGSVRVAPHFAVVGEAWMSPRPAPRDALGAVAARLFSRRWSVDLGWLHTTAGEGAPWLAFGWRSAW
jgi:hypothetical protein